MSDCWCCQRAAETKKKYHLSCLKRLLDVSWIPRIPYKNQDFSSEVRKVAGKMSLSGAQPKASVTLNRKQKSIEIVPEKGTHVLKPQTDQFPELPQNENLCMNIAQHLDMDVPPHGIFSMADGSLCYLIKRFDRQSDGQKIHKEDMAQLLGLHTEAKYSSSLESVGKAITKFAANAYLEAVNFFERVVLCFLVGNGDMHLKNWSLITPETKKNHLAPCYDIVSSSLYLPKEDESALTINGKRNKLRKHDFEALAAAIKIEPQAAENVFNKMFAAKETILSLISSSLLSGTHKEALKNLFLRRLERLSQKN